MKVSYITKHNVSNYGSLLQTFATQEIIKKLGYEPQIINYVRYDLRKDKLFDTLLKLDKKWNKNFLTRLIYRITQMPNYYFMDKKFKKYRKEFYTNLTPIYGSNEELKKNTPIADIYCSGSDQIWGKNGGYELDKAYFLDFVPEGARCISYAASIGLTELNEKDNKDLVELLKKYEKITVREESAIQLLKNNNINSQLVLDPTLLLDKKEWEKVVDTRKINKKYILIYQLHSNKKFEEYAKKLSKKLNLPLIRVTPSLNQLTKIGKLVYLPTPGMFLNYIKNAEFIITDSFHGTVFSIIFNKRFIDINPGKTSTRIESILKLLGIESRLLKSYDDFSLIDQSIDWEKVNNKIKIEREKSTKIFQDMLESKKNNIVKFDKKHCTGCETCAQLCPVNAIEMLENDEGFFEPFVNQDKCINCGACLKRCPQINKQQKNNQKVQVYAAKNKDRNVLLQSSSGGIFSAIAEEIIRSGGVVFGANQNENLETEHVLVKKIEDLYKLRGSKYIQSSTKNTYKQAKEYLEKGQKVLYSGTPCQIAGLKSFIGKEYEGLYTVEVICHGVPNQKLLKEQIKDLEKKYKRKISRISYRDKEYGSWGGYRTYN